MVSIGWFCFVFQDSWLLTCEFPQYFWCCQFKRSWFNYGLWQASQRGWALVSSCSFFLVVSVVWCIHVKAPCSSWQLDHELIMLCFSLSPLWLQMTLQIKSYYWTSLGCWFGRVRAADLWQEWSAPPEHHNVASSGLVECGVCVWTSRETKFWLIVLWL